MAPENRCPSCTFVNDAGALECANCHFPLTEAGPTSAPAAEAGPEVTAEPGREGASAPPSVAPESPIRRVRPIRPRPPGRPDQSLQLQLWLGLGGLAMILVLYTAWTGFKKNNVPAPPVAGADENMQHAADMARAELAKDSTNVNARIMLANVLYDTSNWPEAIIHYRAALRTDPNRITTIVDLGVCYFNLGASEQAVVQFEHALSIEPGHPIALFNMGVVAESREKYPEALKFFQQATRTASQAPPGLAESITQATQRVQSKLAGNPGGIPAGTPK